MPTLCSVMHLLPVCGPSCCTEGNPARMVYIPMEEFIFSLFAPPASSVTPLRSISLLEAYNLITTDVGVYFATAHLRSLTDPKAWRTYKASHFPFATFSGQFAYRRADRIESRSGLVCLDFDHVNPPAEDMQGSFCFSAEGDPVDRLRQQLINDRYFKTLLAFRSPSGDGLKWVTAIDRQRGNHKQWVSSLIAYISMSYGVEPDTQCTDITRSCFLPHDSRCYLHPSFRTGTYHVNCPF